MTKEKGLKELNEAQSVCQQLFVPTVKRKHGQFLVPNEALKKKV